MSARDETEKNMATQKKQDKINQAEMEKRQAFQHNAASKESAVAGQAHGPEIDTTGPGSDHATHTGPGSETSTFTTTGPGSETSNFTTTGPRPDAIPLSTGHGLGLEAESAMYPTGEFGQAGSNQTAAMTGPGHGGLPPMETNTVVDTTTQTSIGGGSAPTSGPTFS